MRQQCPNFHRNGRVGPGSDPKKGLIQGNGPETKQITPKNRPDTLYNLKLVRQPTTTERLLIPNLGSEGASTAKPSQSDNELIGRVGACTAGTTFDREQAEV
jgi:hypothetical protein